MITSKENELIKRIKALSQKKYRDEYKLYIVEGPKMVLEALDYAEVSNIVICEELLNDKKALDSILAKASKRNVKVEYVNIKLFEWLSDTKTPQGTIALVKQNDNMLDLKSILKDKTIFALDKLQDPGNLGTIIRTLDSAGIKHLILSNDTADPYNPKVVRSTMGAIFRLKIYKLDVELKDVLQSLKENGAAVISTALDTKKYYYDINFDENIVIVIGNESQGVSKEVQNISNYKIKIPMLGKTESLNAAVAASIIAYEKVRRQCTKE